MSHVSSSQPNSDRFSATLKQHQYDEIAKYYELFKSGKKGDYEFYVNVARDSGDPILELGCGTGRLLIELVKSGRDVTGIEISRAMLDYAHVKKAALPENERLRCELMCGDMLELPVMRTFRTVIMASGVIQQVGGPMARISLFEAIHSLLEVSGVFAFDGRFWESGEHSDWWETGAADGRVLFDGSWPDPDVTGGRIQRFRSDVMNPSTLQLQRTVFCDHVDADGNVRRNTLRDDEQLAPPEQLVMELERAGFQDIRIFGGFEMESLYASELKGNGRIVCIGRKQ